MTVVMKGDEKVLIIPIILVFVVAAVLFSPENASSAMDAFCDLECMERKVRDHSICC